MVKTTYKKGAKKFFYWWIQKDVNKYIQMIETMKLKNMVESNKNTTLKSKEVISLSRVEEVKQDIWDYGTFMAINMFKEGRYSTEMKRIEDEAEAVVEAMTSRFINVMEKGEVIHPNEFFPTPEYKFMYNNNSNTSSDVFSGSSVSPISIFATMQDLSSKYNIEQMMMLIKKEKVLQIMIKSLIKEYFPSGGKFKIRPGSKHYMVLIWHLLYQASNDIRSFSEKYKLSFLNDGEIRCIYNMLNLYIHFLAIHGKLELSLQERELIFAASALHPLQDDYIDEVGASPEIIKAIEDKIKGNQVKVPDEKAQGIFDLIDVIYSMYPINQNPVLVTIFSKLHEYQCVSTEQKNENISDQDILDISFMKGGYAFAFFGYIAHGDMSVKQFNHFFVMGAIFQICDDFHDLEVDLETGSTTVWTRAIKRNEKLDKVLSATISLQKYYEETTELIPDFKNPVLMRRIELFGIRYDIFRFFLMNQQHFSESYIYAFEDCFPFPLTIPRKVFVSTKPYENLDTFLNILESGKDLMMQSK